MPATTSLQSRLVTILSSLAILLARTFFRFQIVKLILRVFYLTIALGFLDAIETSLKMVDELLRLLSSEVLCSAFKHRLPWPKSTPINYNDLQKLQANPDIEGFGRICFPAMKAVSVTKSPEKVDFMQYLPVPEAENFPE